MNTTSPSQEHEVAKEAGFSCSTPVQRKLSKRAKPGQATSREWVEFKATSLIGLNVDTAAEFEHTASHARSCRSKNVDGVAAAKRKAESRPFMRYHTGFVTLPLQITRLYSRQARTASCLARPRDSPRSSLDMLFNAVQCQTFSPRLQSRNVFRTVFRAGLHMPTVINSSKGTDNTLRRALSKDPRNDGSLVSHAAVCEH